MDTVIEKISEIELAATAIMEDAKQLKKAYAKEMEERTLKFDKQIEESTQKEIEKLRVDMEVHMNERLMKLKADSKKIIETLEKRYKDYHVQYIEELFQTIIKE